VPTRLAWPALLVSALGCTSSASDPEPELSASCAPGETATEEGCAPAGLPLDMPCAPGEVPTGGGCVPAGVPPERCVGGFVVADRGCAALLPDEPCAPGRMALAGETRCRPVMPCPAERFGGIPVDADTEYVDAGFSGAPDGSAAAPWPTIQQAVDAAAEGAVVAIAPASYAEHVLVSGKSVRLWGSCPDAVEIVGPAAGVAAIDIIDGAHGTEVHALAVRGAQVGVGISNALEVVLDRLWVHDTGDQGLLVDRILGPASATLSDSLVESTGLMGMVIVGAGLRVERTVVRDAAGRGIDAHASPYGSTPSELSIADVLVERSEGGGIVVAGSLARVERAVVLDTAPDALQKRGWGIALFDVPGMPPTHAELVDSVVERSHDAGVVASATEALVDGVTIRDVVPSPLANGGIGLIVEAWPGTNPLATATLRHTLVERGHTLGLFIGGARGVLVEGVLARDTQPHASGAWGWGIAIQVEPDTAQPAQVELRHCAVERSGESGIFVFGSEALVEATAVRDTSPGASGRFGSALTLSNDPFTGLRSTVRVHASLFERSTEAGAVVAGSDAVIEQSLLRDTTANGLGTHGDGILVVSYAEVGHLDLLRSRVDNSQRAAVACFGGRAAISASALSCHSYALDAESHAGHSCELVDIGGNACGCGTLDDSCKAVSSSLEPPAPVGSPFEPDH
jgi:hypothetical protein